MSSLVCLHFALNVDGLISRTRIERMVRLLHAAGWQTGKQFGGFDPEDAALLADARIKGVRTIAELAAVEKVDILARVAAKSGLGKALSGTRPASVRRKT